MERLNAFDAGFLDAEDADPHISLAIGAVAILDGPVPDHDEVINVIGGRALAVPRLRQVVRRHPMDLSAPVWVDDPALDVAHHVRRAALPAPGDDAALFTFTAEAMEPRLDRERPLWQCWVIEGLADGRWALLMKVHHCVGDGMATMHMLAGLSDGGEGEPSVGQVQTTPAPGRWPYRRAVALNPLRWAQDLVNLTSKAASAAAATLGGTVQIVDSLLRTGPDTTLNGAASSMRRYSSVHVSLVDIASICHAFDVTLNDVALAAITNSFRSAMHRRGEVPHRRSLRTLVPVSVRAEDAADLVDNRVSVMLPYLPVDEPDVAQQLRTVHRRMARVKSSGQRQAGISAASVVKMVPFALASRAIRTLTSLPQRGVVTLATNVAGPREHLTVMGREVVRLLPVPPVALRLRAAVAILSYGEDLMFGVTTDFDTFPDVDDVARGIAATIARLTAVARHPHPGRPALALVGPTATG